MYYRTIHNDILRNELPRRKRSGYPSGTDPIAAKQRGIGPARNKAITLTIIMFVAAAAMLVSLADQGY